jgi:hypothetical protein
VERESIRCQSLQLESKGVSSLIAVNEPSWWVEVASTHWEGPVGVHLELVFRPCSSSFPKLPVWVKEIKLTGSLFKQDLILGLVSTVSTLLLAWETVISPGILR